jgi:hypothetical protein
MSGCAIWTRPLVVLASRLLPQLLAALPIALKVSRFDFIQSDLSREREWPRLLLWETPQGDSRGDAGQGVAVAHILSETPKYRIPENRKVS